MQNSEQKPLVSVIIPVYNTENYVDECLRSILSQSYKNIEVIVVDDGSTDQSLDICRRYAQDTRVRLLAEAHHGATAARKKGVMAAQGKWIMFVDSDDYLYEETLVKMVAIADGADIVIGPGNDELRYFQTLPQYIDSDKYLKMWGQAELAGFLWGKMYNRSLFDEKVFDIPEEIVMGEDVLMNFRLAIRNHKRVSVFKQKTCFHRSNPTSVYQTFVPTFDYYYTYIGILRTIIKDVTTEQHCAQWLRIWEEEYLLWILKNNGYRKPANPIHPLLLDFEKKVSLSRGWHPLDRLLIKAELPFVLSMTRKIIKIWNRIKRPRMILKDLC